MRTSVIGIVHHDLIPLLQISFEIFLGITYCKWHRAQMNRYMLSLGYHPSFSIEYCTAGVHPLLYVGGVGCSPENCAHLLRYKGEGVFQYFEFYWVQLLHPRVYDTEFVFSEEGIKVHQLVHPHVYDTEFVFSEEGIKVHQLFHLHMYHTVSIYLERKIGNDRSGCFFLYNRRSLSFKTWTEIISAKDICFHFTPLE